MAARPYQAHSEAELLDLRRNLQGVIKDAGRERDAYMQRNRDVNFWNSEGFKEIEEKISRLWSQDTDIQAELTARRNERASAPAAPAGWYPDPHGQASLRWWDGYTWTQHTS